MAARTYKRDSRGRFAGGGGSSGGGSKAKASAKPAGDGRRGPRGGKTGTRAEQRKAAAAQAARSAEFRGKATAGRGAKDAYKAAARGARMSEKGAARKVVGAAAKKAGKGDSSKVVLDEARWRRVVQRAKTRGEVRAYIEGKRPSGYNASTEKRVFAAYATRQRAEQFLLGLTRNKADKSFRGSRVSGLDELNANFQSRKRSGTGSTSIGVAARNRIYDEQRRAKRAANKERRSAPGSKTPRARKRR